MKYLVLQKVANEFYLVANKPFDKEKQAHMMVDLQRECNPDRFFQIVEILEDKNLEVVKWQK